MAHPGGKLVVHTAGRSGLRSHSPSPPLSDVVAEALANIATRFLTWSAPVRALLLGAYHAEEKTKYLHSRASLLD
jgi:hypothetical protein